MSLTPSPIPEHFTSGRFQTLTRSFRHRNYRLYFTGQFLSLIGIWMQQIAQSWLVYRLTESSFMLGITAFAGQFPVFLLAALGGVAADRFHRRTILIFTQVGSMVLAFILAWLTMTHSIQVWEVIVLATGLGIINALDLPTRQSFIVELVGKEDLHNAIGLNSSMFNTARILGPSLAGILVAAVGEGWCFLINAASFLAVIVCLLAMNIPRRPVTQDRPPVLEHLREGFVYAWTTPDVRAILILLGTISALGLSYIVLMPVFAKSILHSGPQGLGLLMAAAGFGSLLGALMLAARSQGKGIGKYAFFAVVFFGAGVILFALSHWFWLSMVLLVPVGFAMIVAMISANTMLQLLAPDHMRGRVMALFSMMYMGMAPFGALLAGSLAGWIGAPATVGLSGIACIVAAVVLGRKVLAL